MTLKAWTTADGLITSTIQDCLQGDYITTDKDNSWEQLHYQTALSIPQARIMTNKARPLNLVVAVARFAWLVAGNNRVEDIAYYEPKVRSFSDDGLTVPGSDYGLRLFQPRPGLNQIQGVVDRLRVNPLSRQAAAVVWQPEDAVRYSGDIPCTFGMFFHVRERHPYVDHPELIMCVNMRSNNAFRILPFNVFECTMLQELVATELGLATGRYMHWAASMHVYDNERETPPTRAIADSVIADSIVMPHMPSSHPGALQQASMFAALEAELRHACTENDILDVIDKANEILDPYWVQLLGVLVCWTAAKHQLAEPPYYIVHPDIREMVWVNCQKAYN